jgi:hypothetical protein
MAMKRTFGRSVAALAAELELTSASAKSKTASKAFMNPRRIAIGVSDEQEKKRPRAAAGNSSFRQ